MMNIAAFVQDSAIMILYDFVMFLKKKLELGFGEILYQAVQPDKGENKPLLRGWNCKLLLSIVKLNAFITQVF